MDIYVECPHCTGIFIVSQSDINCRIFRHFVFKDTLQQLNPHAPKAECDRVVEESLGYGCARPIELISNGHGGWIAKKCEYK